MVIKMIVAFCGHKSYVSEMDDEKYVLEILEKVIGNNTCEFFICDNGGFDDFSYCVAKKYKNRHPKARLVLVTPYPVLPFNSNCLYSCVKEYDAILYPGFENVPLRFAILYRNRWLAEQADIIFSYVKKRGGAFKTRSYALKLGKEVYDVALKNVK